MANHKSAIKRHRQSLKKRDQNRNIRSAVRTSIKNTKEAVEKGNSADALTLLKKAQSTITKAGVKGSLHKKNAARRISRLAKKVAAKSK